MAIACPPPDESGSVPFRADASAAGGLATRLVLANGLAGDVARPAGHHQFNHGSVGHTATAPFRIGVVRCGLEGARAALRGVRVQRRTGVDRGELDWTRHVPARPALAEGPDTAGRRNDQMGIGLTGALFFALRVTWGPGNAPARAGGRCWS
jgi:hypothetical protein